MKKVLETVTTILFVWLAILTVCLFGAEPHSFSDDGIQSYEYAGRILIKVYIYSTGIFTLSVIATFISHKLSD